MSPLAPKSVTIRSFRPLSQPPPFYADRLDQAYDRLAYHYSKTDNASKAVEYLSRFAEKAAAIDAHAEAVTTLEEARAHAERLSTSPKMAGRCSLS